MQRSEGGGVSASELYAYREWLAEYQPLLTGDPAAQGHFDVYLSDRRLTYDRTPCRPSDVIAPFLLHIFPDNANNLDGAAREYGFANRDFDFFRRAARCWKIAA